MRKIFKLTSENKKPERLLDNIKYEIRKYIKRERRKPLLCGVDYWDLKCKFAKNDEEPKSIEVSDITECINDASNSKCESFYIEIISTKGKHQKKE